jgi:hypothetical protein
LLVVSGAVMMALPSGAGAHPDADGAENRIVFEEDFAGEGVEQDKQHGGDEGHLPPVQNNVEVVGQVQVDDRGAGLTGRVADVAAFGNFAYLNAFRHPSCAEGGVHVIDISDPTAPVELVDSFIPTSPGSYAGEGIKILPIAGMDVLIHQNETCAFDPAVPSGGISLWDVTDPANPLALALHVGDTDLVDVEYLEGSANDSHSFDAWTNPDTGRTYASLVDNFESEDVDIMDITDPANPVLINELNLVDATRQETPEGLTSIFAHDMDVQRIGRRDVMALAYWDGGYVLLDVTDPTPEGLFLMGETDFAALDEERLARGVEITPEGNAHQVELNRTGRFMVGTDEDFDPFRVEATITEGPNAGSEFVAVQASGTPPLTEDDSFTAQPTFVGEACAPLAAGTGVALVERGTCSFQVKLDNVAAAGYTAGVVFNSLRVDCLSLVRMLAEGDIPFMFVNREVGLQILGQDVEGDAACTAATPAVGSPTSTIALTVTFDGWGYVRLFATDFARGPNGGATVNQIDTYAIPESQDPAFATGFGDLSVHEVAMDTVAGSNLAYLSYYAGGVRVIRWGPTGIREVGAFIDEGGSNFWGVELHVINGTQYLLASDRDYGLYILNYTGRR